MSDCALIGRPGMPLVSWTPELTTVHNEIGRILAGEQRRIVVKGPPGVGRTYLTAVLASELRSREDSPTSLIARTLTPDQFRDVSIGKFDVVVADDYLDNARGLDRSLSNLRDGVSWFLTAAEGAHSLLEEESVVLRLPSLEAVDKSDAVEFLATFFLAQYIEGLDWAHPEEEVEHVFDRPARDLLPALTWSTNLAMVAEFARSLAVDLEMKGVSEGGLLSRPITSEEVAELYKETRRRLSIPPVVGPRPTVVVEGESDKVWLEGAAALHEREGGDDLLSGISITVANGAPEVVPMVLKIILTEGVAALALLDGDSPAEKYSKAGEALRAPVVRVPRPRYLPPSPYGDDPEIEDLVQVELLARFYENHPDVCPETEVHHMGKLARLAPHREKVRVANWCVERASADEIEGLIDLLQKIRRSLFSSSPRQPKERR